MGKLRPGRFLQLHRAGSAGVQQAQPGLAAGAAPVRPAAPPAVPMVEKRPAVPSCLAMASEEEQPSALSDKQLRPLFLLALADLLAATAVLSTATIQLLPAPLFVPAYAACPYGLMLATTFYAVSFLMVVVYAYEAYRTVHGWRAWPVAALQYVGRKDVGLEGKIIFFLYLLLVLSCCTLLYRRVKLRCQRNAGAPLLGLERDGFAGRSVRSVSQVSHNFQLVFLLCWAPAFLLTLLSFTSIKPASVYVLYVATAVTVPLQGFLHSLVYGWLRQNFRQEAAGETPSPQPRRGLQPFYDEALGTVP
ncbi:hypothetical protein Q9966_013988 [Columba livia]|nr:hypothetical protein Q9966_013988 [Columba livia]